MSLLYFMSKKPRSYTIGRWLQSFRRTHVNVVLELALTENVNHVISARYQHCRFKSANSYY